ncbi:MAG: xylulokinase [Clostridia bacterium]|nr:xylulokinase [Clostridia bacterium]
MDKYLLGIDIGTSGCKVALFRPDGSAAAQSTGNYPVEYPHPGWAQQHPDMWWEAACGCIRRVLEESGADPAQIEGVGVDGQSWSAIAVDEQGRVLTPTPIWTDTRAQAQCDGLRGRIGEEELFRCCGNPLQPSYTLPKILWYRDHMPEVYAKARWILQSNSYFVYRLTGRASQDLSQGYGLSCFDMSKRCWDTALADRIGIRPELLPPLYQCHEIVGNVTEEAAAQTGLAQGTPVVAGGLDAACGTLGAGVVKPGQTQEQGGQAGGMSIAVDEYAADERLILGCHVVPDQWLLQGGTTGGGGALKWLRETCCPDLSFEEMSSLADTVEPGCEGVLFLPYMAGERSPIWNPAAKGVFFGLDYMKGRAHMIRAVMEGVAFSLRHNLETAKAAGAQIGALRAMGGSANSLVWTQLKADITGHAIEVPSSDTATTLGAAILAGVGTGVYASFEEAAERTVRVQRIHQPDPEKKGVYDAAYQRYLELYERLEPMMKG